tara:strand:+ start:1881 stop:2150 length:270 start_codon:yes stop_codon:yes gene_type:complete
MISAEKLIEPKPGRPLESVLGSIDFSNFSQLDKRPYRPEVFKKAAAERAEEDVEIDLFNKMMEEKDAGKAPEFDRERIVRNYEAALSGI